jgi:hypothetical protein
MAVAARFYVAKITRHAYNPGHVEVVLQAVVRGPENKAWASATPNGQITMTVNNEAAGAWFTGLLGDDVAITFDRADPLD